MYSYITTFPTVKSTSVIIGQTMYCNDLSFFPTSMQTVSKSSDTTRYVHIAMKV